MAYNNYSGDDPGSSDSSSDSTSDSSKLVDRYNSNRHSKEEDKTFILPQTIQFGFHNVCSDQIRISQNGLMAEKKDPNHHYAYGVAYGAKPLKGTAEFEVKMTDYGTGWSGTLKLGVAKYQANRCIQRNNIPRYSPEASSYCVWSSDKVHNRLCSTVQNAQEKQYGLRNLDSLRKDDRLGLRLNYDGTLVFFVNGEHQGVAAENVYEKGHEVYAVVDHYANCKATVITRAGKTMKQIQYICTLSTSPRWQGYIQLSNTLCII